MEDWVKRLHQWGVRQRRHFCTVQDPIVRVLAREKATSRNMHPNVLAQMDAAADTGNKQKLSEKKADVLSTRQKWQRDEGRFRELKDFDDIKEEKLTWVE
jgi:hypothetical protein